MWPYHSCAETLCSLEMELENPIFFPLNCLIGVVIINVRHYQESHLGVACQSWLEFEICRGAGIVWASLDYPSMEEARPLEDGTLEGRNVAVLRAEACQSGVFQTFATCCFHLSLHFTSLFILSFAQ